MRGRRSFSPRGMALVTTGRGKGKVVDAGSSIHREDDEIEEENIVLAPLKLHRPYRAHQAHEIPRRMIDYMKKIAKCKKDRGEDPYEYEKSVEDPCFWNEFTLTLMKA